MCILGVCMSVCLFICLPVSSSLSAEFYLIDLPCVELMPVKFIDYGIFCLTVSVVSELTNAHGREL